MNKAIDATAPDISDHQADLDRYISQTKSMLVGISDDQQLKALGTVNLVNVLWVIADRVNDIERVTNQIYHLSQQDK